MITVILARIMILFLFVYCGYLLVSNVRKALKIGGNRKPHTRDYTKEDEQEWQKIKESLSDIEDVDQDDKEK